jgi:hypothetical protein
MKKMIVWTVALCFVLASSLVFAEEAKKGPEMLPGGTETKSGIPGGVDAPKKTRAEAKAERAAKKAKKVKKETGEKKGPEMLPGGTETKSGIPGGVDAPQKSRQDVKKEKAEKAGQAEKK